MSGANARDGRRRRMLQDASRELPAYKGWGASSQEPGDAASATSTEGRRYAFVDGSLGGALARRHFPNHVLVPIGFAVASGAAVAGVVSLHAYRETINAATGGSLASLIDIQSPTSLASWFASSAMLITALMAVAIYAVRRRRVDDYRGKHRLWRGAAFAAGLLSLSAATHFETGIGQSVATATGISMLDRGAEWWIAGAALLLGWVGVRVVLDVKESRLALTMLVLAGVAGAVTLVAHFAGLPLDAATNAAVATAAHLASYLSVATALLSYTRFLRRDVAAGVATKPQKARSTEGKSIKLAKQTRSTKSVESQEKAEQGTAGSKQKTKKQKAAKAKQSEVATTKWTDGSDGSDDPYQEEGQPRKLSKSERKRLRKIKAERRAA